jgi:hypothetical protein
MIKGEMSFHHYRNHGCIWFVPKIALPKVLLANILIELLVAYKLANIG